MNITSLFEAVQEIVRASRLHSSGQNHDLGTATHRPPFFFIVGAGISCPSIPLAAEITEQCRERAQQMGRKVASDPKSKLEAYSAAFDAAFPHPYERQQYLRHLIRNKPITTANLRLAHLLLKKALTNIAITTNFDDLLTRALNLLGQREYTLCDHPATVDRIDHDSDELQIVHVHGTYWFYDLCNLVSEMGFRAQPSNETAFTMVGLLDRILANRSPLVVGYSGGEGDVIMTTLKRRLYPHRRLPYRMYWFCYDTDAVNGLPEWLKQHPDVYFVFHPDSRAVQKRASLRRRQTDWPPSRSPELPDEPVLTAQAVFDELIRTVELDEPRLTSDPLGFYADLLEQSFPSDGDDSTPEDVYSLRSLAAKLRKTASQIKGDSVLEPVRQAVRRSQYREAIEEGIKLVGKNGAQKRLSHPAASELVTLLTVASHGVPDGSEEQAEGFDAIIRLGQNLIPEDDAAPVARAHIGKARNHLLKGNWSDAEAILLETLRQFPDLLEAPTSREATQAHYLKELAGLRIGGTEEESAVLRELVARINNAGTHPSEDFVADLLASAGEKLLNLQAFRKALAIFDMVLERFGAPAASSNGTSPGAPAAHLRRSVAIAHSGKVQLFLAMHRKNEAIVENDRLLARFNQTPQELHESGADDILRLVVDAWTLRDELISDDRRRS